MIPNPKTTGCLTDCKAMLSLCAAACCRNWTINLTWDEYDSGLYEAQVRAGYSDDTDGEGNLIGGYEMYEMRQDMDGRCVYLDENCRCRIYEQRPRVCREYTCQETDGMPSMFPWETHAG